MYLTAFDTKMLELPLFSQSFFRNLFFRDLNGQEIVLLLGEVDFISESVMANCSGRTRAASRLQKVAQGTPHPRSLIGEWLTS